RLGNTPSQIERTYAHMFKSTQINIAKSLNDFEHKKNKNKKVFPLYQKMFPPHKKILYLKAKSLLAGVERNSRHL
ncbi:MAG: hypothetical protein ACK5L6_08185, partial [Anaerorhabdus sp.]|uniref:hypothetical protein n=1 Tax=Anaerorhabdus sp. TaxID=1872524 RepID=UPI003A8381FC